jgi:hypothetical protein
MRYVPERAEGYSLTLVDSSGRPMGVGRGSGLHLGDVLRHIRGELGLPVDDTPLPEASAAVKARMMGGFVFENCIERAFRELMPNSRKVHRPDELLVDGIFMNPDGFCADEWAVDEYKATSKSRRKFDNGLQELHEVDLPFEETALFNDFKLYFLQLMSYCRALSTNWGNLIIWWQRGNYSKDWSDESGKPDVRMYPFYFENSELDHVWLNVILPHAANLRRKLEAA